jgi:hypothetical protein
MNVRTLAAGLLALGVVIALVGMFVNIRYLVTVHEVNGLVTLSSPSVTRNLFVTFVGVAIIYFSVHLFLAKEDVPVTVMDAELLAKAEKEREK